MWTGRETYFFFSKYGILELSEELQNHIDKKEEMKNVEWETALRVCAIHACELIVQKSSGLFLILLSFLILTHYRFPITKFYGLRLLPVDQRQRPWFQESWTTLHQRYYFLLKLIPYLYKYRNEQEKLSCPQRWNKSIVQIDFILQYITYINMPTSNSTLYWYFKKNKRSYK